MGVKMQNIFVQQSFIKSSWRDSTGENNFKLLPPHSSLSLRMASGYLASSRLRDVRMRKQGTKAVLRWVSRKQLGLWLPTHGIDWKKIDEKPIVFERLVLSEKS